MLRSQAAAAPADLTAGRDNGRQGGRRKRTGRNRRGKPEATCSFGVVYHPAGSVEVNRNPGLQSLSLEGLPEVGVAFGNLEDALPSV